MTRLLLALQFLTIFPLKIKKVNEKMIAGSMIYFPVVGLLLGWFLSGLNKLLLVLNFPQISANIILVVALVIITGGMHLDGLSDTADALFSARPKDKMLEIMRESHIGVMGALSLISAILLKIGLLSALGATSKMVALLLMGVLSRWSVVLSMFLFPYGRQDGKAKVFIEGMNLKIFITSLIAVLLFAFAIGGAKGLLALSIIAGCIYLSGKIICRKIGGITGDTLGATSELTEIATLFIVCIG